MRARPKMLDLYGCQGGAAMGYHLAGWDVTGVDIEPQPRYPFTFVQADALDFLAEHGHEYNAIHASPPCHDHTPLVSVAGTDGSYDLLGDTLAALEAFAAPWVVENVPASHLKADIVLCGKMFDLRVKRHRKFKSNMPLAQPAHPATCRTTPTATSRRRERWAQGWDISITGDVGTYLGPEAMGIDWMTGNGLSQAIPPAYTQFIGERLLTQLDTPND